MSRLLGTRAPIRTIAALAAVVLVATACTAPPPIESLRITPDRYAEAFDTAVEVARHQGLTASVRDRRRGIIEAGPTPAPSLLEPWKPATSLERRLDHTVSYERRRARFEFAPAGTGPDAEATGPLSGPDVLAVGDPIVDRTTHGGPLELHVRVYVEQSHKPGLRPDTWTRTRTTQAIEVDADGVDRPWLFWTPVARDPGLEQALLARIERALAGRTSDSPPEAPAATPADS